MQPFAADYLDHLRGLFTAIEDTLTGLPQAGLDWVPGPEMNSIGVLAAHVAGTARFLLGDTLMQDSSNRDRPAEFATEGVDAATLIQRLRDVLTYCESAVETLTLDDLHQSRPWRDGSQVTVAWCLDHALEHTALHVGHMQVTRQFWELRTRD